MRLRNVTIGFLTLAAALASASLGAQEDRPRGLRLYYMDIDLRTPRPIRAQGIDGAEETFWYLRFTIKNPSAHPVHVTPRFTMLTGKGHEFRDVMPAHAIRAIERRLDREISVGVMAAGPIPAGGEVEGVAIFPEPASGANRIYVRVGGLTNEYFLDRTDGEAKPVFKVYQIRFDRPGDSMNLAIDPILRGAQKWVWENEAVE